MQLGVKENSATSLLAVYFNFTLNKNPLINKQYIYLLKTFAFHCGYFGTVSNTLWEMFNIHTIIESVKGARQDVEAFAGQSVPQQRFLQSAADAWHKLRNILLRLMKQNIWFIQANTNVHVLSDVR